MSDLINGLKDQCQICLENKWKYCCPKCQTKTCSLTCVKAHKSQSDCDGVVDTAAFVNKSEFKENELLVQRDYNFLMGLDRTISVSKQDIRSKNNKILNRGNYHNPNKRFQRHSVAKEESEQDQNILVRRGVKVKQLPKGMQRSNINKSGWDKKRNCFVWTIEFILIDHESGKEIARHISFRVPEGTTLKDSIHYKINDLLKASDQDNNQNKAENKSESDDKNLESFYFLSKVDSPASDKKFFPLNKDHLIADLIRDQTVIEFPTIIVSPKPEVKGYSVYVEEVEGSDEDDSDSDSSSDSSSEEESSDDSDEEPQESTSKNQNSSDKAPHFQADHLGLAYVKET